MLASSDRFYQGVLTIDDVDMFDLLRQESQFSSEGKGRVIGIAVLPDLYGNIPIVRTTTKFPKAPAVFPLCYRTLIGLITIDAKNPNLHFNNAMVEVYDNSYCKMGFHTDQALDLHDYSWICLFSCYKNPNAKNIRFLVVVNKETKEETKIPLLHNSYTIFSTCTNRKHVHKIVLENEQKSLDDSEWLGLTLRESKTYIRFDENNNPILPNEKPLRMATEEECKDFCRLKAEENNRDDFVYPEIDYTISPSDLMKLETTSDRWLYSCDLPTSSDMI
jgi:hypothetical protein